MAIPQLVPQHVHPQPSIDTGVWFLQLRWVAVAGQLLTMAAVEYGLGVALPDVDLLLLIGFTALTNVAFWIWLRRLKHSGRSGSDLLPAPQVIPVLMLVDVFVLTGMLFLTAGIANPFSLFYFVNVAIAGVVVSTGWAWSIWATTVVGVALLLVRALPLDILSPATLEASPPGTAPIWTIPKLGYWVAFATCSGVILYFITALTGQLRRRELLMKEMEEARMRNRQLEGLATLAAGAAHELSTPLSTIAVVANELGRALENAQVPDMVRRDVRLIRSELDHCRQILDRLTFTAGQAAGEQLSVVTLSQFMDEALLGVRSPELIRCKVAPTEADSTNLLPVQAAAQAIRNLLQNALDASPPDTPVEFVGTVAEEHWVFQVTDQGPGMPPEVLERIGEPFFTTKEPGRGMGLGLYLTGNVLRRLGGDLKFETRQGVGTTAIARIPIRSSGS